MTKLSLALPETGTKDSIAEPRVTTALKAIEEFANGSNLDTAGGNFKAEGITEASLSSALKTKLGGSFVGLEGSAQTVGFEAESGKLYFCTKSLTCTLPAATNGRVIGVIAIPVLTTEFIKVSAKAGKVIRGDFFGAEVATLTQFQHLLLEADGTNWYILGGEPKREQTYGARTSREQGIEFEASNTRPVFVTVTAFIAEGKSAVLTVGGVNVGESLNNGSGTNRMLFQFVCPPGQKWVISSAGALLESSYLTL